jgi:hypothetical protein
MNRLGFLGGSDMRRIMSGDWLKLWEEKTGRVESDDLSKVLPVQLGSYTEQFNLDWFAQEYQVEIKDSQREFKLNWNGVPLKGQVDGRINRSHDMPDIIECKHTYEMNRMESCLQMYMPQMQFYMWLAQSNGCYLSVIFGNRRWESVYVQLDWDYIHKMQVHITEFWRLVREDIRPFNDEDVPPISIDKIKVDGLVRRDASSDNEFISRCHDYIEQEQNAKLFESAKADLKAMVGDDEREVYCDLLTIKRDKRGSLRVTVKENH